MGLINRMLPVAELEKYVLDYANTIAGNAPLTIAAVKQSVKGMGKNEAQRDIALCDKMVDACFASDHVQRPDLISLLKSSILPSARLVTHSNRRAKVPGHGRSYASDSFAYVRYPTDDAAVIRHIRCRHQTFRGIQG